MKIDESLHTGKRTLRTRPQSLLLGSSGARLWADYLDPVPGFSGCIDFVHKMNIPVVFYIECDAAPMYEPLQADWFPSHLTVQHSSSSVSLTEEKYITWNDCAVSCQSWENVGSRDIRLRLKIADYFQPNDRGFYQGIIENSDHHYHVRIVMSAGNVWKTDAICLRPGQKVSFVIAASFGLEETDPTDVLKSRVRCIMESQNDCDRLVAMQVEDYQKWYDRTPAFRSNEPLIDRTWAYRWFILRHNLAVPGYGNLPYPLFYEGRSHKMRKEPYQPSGWEFTQLIPLSIPMHILDARWHYDQANCMGSLRNIIRSQDEDGIYHCIYVDRFGTYYANFIPWACYQLYLTDRDPAILSDILPSLKKQVRGWKKVLVGADDTLLIEMDHKRTGKEYQPSFWYFTGFPDDCKDESRITPLKRVDRNVYYYMNALGVAGLCKIAGDDDWKNYHRLACEVRKDILTKMWDEDSHFFYDLKYDNDQKAFVKNIVDFYPYWADMTDQKYAEGLRHLLSSEFSTPCPFPSVSTDCSVFAPQGGWKGKFIKGRNGCVWDGPTWPYTNSIVLDALAIQSKKVGHAFDSDFGRLFRQYSLLHFSDRDLQRPCLVEHYDSLTGEPLSGETDYNHSYFIDLLIRHVAGLEVKLDRFVLNPLNIGLAFFDLDHLRAAGRELRIAYRAHGYKEEEADFPEGYSFYVDGKLVLHRNGLKKWSIGFHAPKFIFYRLKCRSL